MRRSDFIRIGLTPEQVMDHDLDRFAIGVKDRQPSRQRNRPQLAAALAACKKLKAKLVVAKLDSRAGTGQSHQCPFSRSAAQAQHPAQGH